jgi:hypothetical protein
MEVSDRKQKGNQLLAVPALEPYARGPGTTIHSQERNRSKISIRSFRSNLAIDFKIFRISREQNVLGYVSDSGKTREFRRKPPKAGEMKRNKKISF